MTASCRRNGFWTEWWSANAGGTPSGVAKSSDADHGEQPRLAVVASRRRTRAMKNVQNLGRRRHQLSQLSRRHQLFRREAQGSHDRVYSSLVVQLRQFKHQRHKRTCA